MSQIIDMSGNFQALSNRILRETDHKEREWEKAGILCDNKDYINFLSCLTKQDAETLFKIVDEFSKDEQFRNEFCPRLNEFESSDEIVPGDMRFHSLTLYVIVRAIRPQWVIETGVASGKSSAFILLALHHNDCGNLISIDLHNKPGNMLPDGAFTHTGKKPTGWLVPSYLRKRWELFLGDSYNLLPQVIERVHGLDIFLHDSLHTYEHVSFELGIVTDHLRDGGLVLVDDMDLPAGWAFEEFLVRYGLYAYRFHNLAGAIFEKEMRGLTLSKIEDVTAIVCTWNAEATIRDCLESLRKNNVGEIILVDANSEDKTIEIAGPYVDIILTDPREGLGKARNIGIQRASKRYILNVGPDNVIPNGSIQRMIYFLESGGFSGVSAMTFVKTLKYNYISWAMYNYKRARYYPGERDVIGTPTLFTKDLLIEFPYDDNMSDADDADLCDRLRAKGCRFAISDAFVYEVGTSNLNSVLERWKRYGKSDWEIYNKFSAGWPLNRKIKSLLHPLKTGLVSNFIIIRGFKRFAMAPFLLIITIIRYYYWLSYAIGGKKKRGSGIFS